MRTRLELQASVGRLLHDLRKSHGYSIRKMADLIHVDERTYARYESGTSQPDASDFVFILTHFGGNAIHPLLEFINPSVYSQSSSLSEIRSQISEYFSAAATDAEVAELNYILSGNHGSSFSAQIAMFAMIDHLPMCYRVAVAELTDTLWHLAESRGELIDIGTSPDVALFREALALGKQAACNHSEFYSTSK